MLRNRIKELREESEQNQEDIAKKLNVSRGTYANYEIGRTELSIYTVVEIANLFGVSVDYLCGNTDIREPYYSDQKLCRHINQFLMLYKDILKD